MFRKLNWTMTILLTLIPMIGIVGTSIYVYYNGVIWQEPFMMIFGWWVAGMGITFGYHRLFAHRSFKAHKVVQFFAMLLGTSALQNTILKWCSDHRTHHKKLDTEEDPYSITKGFFHAHIGWIIQKAENPINGVHDLEKNPVVKFQNKYYWPIAIGLSFILPMAIGAMYGRPFGGLLWGGFLRITLVHHFTFFINSLCHYSGKRPFEPNSTARDAWWVAFFTFGEGFHNFHHKFQWDYRNGIRWYDFDPGKWAIKFLSFFGLTKDIRRVEEYQIFQARVNGLKESIKNYYPKLPTNIQKTCHEKVAEFQDKAHTLYESWQKMEKEFRAMKKVNLRDKIQFNIMKKKRKLYRAEYYALLNGLMVVVANLQNGQYISS